MSRTRIIGLALLALLSLGAVAYAATGAGKVTKYRARFSTEKTSAASGLHLLTKGKPPAKGTSEPAAIRQTVILPAGAKLHLSALPQCKASDGAIAEQGAEGACPSKSRVGSGSADGLLNGSDVHFDVAIYAVRGKLVFAAERNGTPLKMSFKGVQSGKRTLKLTVPTLNGAIKPTRFEATIGAHPGKATWLTTPKSCPKSKHWIARGIFQGRTSASGGSAVGPAQKVSDRERCHT